MRVSREQVTENRRVILESASRLFRERGFEAVSVVDIMKAAGLTHGGFYGYFKSKDELAAQALAQAQVNVAAPSGDLADYVSAYLSRKHCDDLAGGCPTAALAGDAIRQNGGVRSEMTAGLKTQIERLSRVAPGEDDAGKRQAAIGACATMVGALILARMCDDPALSDEVLSETRAWLAVRLGENNSAH